MTGTVARPAILIVDDQQANRVALRRLLGSLDVEVVEAASGNEALAKTLDREFALILLDVNMPDMDGYEAASLLHGEEMTRTIPVIFVTAAYKDDFHRIKGYDVGAVDYIEKPIEPRILKSKVGVFLELDRYRREQAALLRDLEERNRRLTEEIAHRERLAEDLRDREKRFMEFAMAASDWFWETGPDLRVTYVSGRIEDAMGFPAAHFIGKPLESLLDGQDGGDPLQDWLGEMMARKVFRNLRKSATTADGRVIQISMNGVPVFGDGDGAFLGYRGTGANITELVRLEERLIDAIECIPASFMLFDADDRLILCNRMSGTMFPEVADALKSGACFEDLVRRYASAPDVRRDEAWVREHVSLHRNPSGAVEERLGEHLWVQTIERPTSEGGRVSMHVDISEMKRRERELAEVTGRLRHSNAELQQFAYIASHDLQEPLRMITSYLQLLQRNYVDQLDADAREFIGYTVDGAKRLQRLIFDLLDFSRVETKGGAPRPVDSGAALRAALANLEVATAEAGALIYPGDLPRVMADEGQLIRLFQNLIDNAIKYRAPERPPVVHVNAAFNGEVWVFSVSDNGIGIDPKHFDRVFTIFQRLHGRDEYSGTGIGLAVCKKIVERHGGRIWIESTPNEGSTFLFTLGALPVPTETVPDAGHERGETR